MEMLDFVTNISWIAGVCFILGLVFVVFEMFHPGFGAPGITGAILLLIGILLTARSILQALIMIVILLAILGVALTIVLHSATKGYISRNLVLHDSLHKSVGYGSNDELEFFIGRVGTTITPLRPSGSVDFDGVKLDVVSEGEFIPKDTLVKVVKVEGLRIVVKLAK